MVTTLPPWDFGRNRAGRSVGRCYTKVVQLSTPLSMMSHKIIACAFLAPDIVETILEGRQPAGLTLAKLTYRLPGDWTDQRRRLGFAQV